MAALQDRRSGNGNAAPPDLIPGLPPADGRRTGEAAGQVTAGGPV